MSGFYSRFLIFCIGLFSCTVYAEKFFTWVDSDGNVRHSVIKEGIDSSPRTNPGTKSDTADPVLPEASPDSTQSEASSSIDLTKVNPENFVDGDELERKQRPTRKNDTAHYIWLDAEGRMRTTIYKRGEGGRPLVESGRIINSAVDAPLSISSYTEIRQSTTDFANADPKALSILGIDRENSVLSQFAQQCCRKISSDFTAELEWNEARFVEINLHSKHYIFDTGKSAYEILVLPQTKDKYTLRLRSFIRDNRLMVPTLVFLDGDFDPVSLIYDATSSYVEENWFKYGYLQSAYQIQPGANERYLLLLTQAKDLKSQTIVETGKNKLISLKHGRYGSFEVYLMHPD